MKRQMLTGKAATDFLKEKGYLEWEVDEIYQMALIIDWLDSVGIHISIQWSLNNFCSVVESEEGIRDSHWMETREQAIKSAIKYANDIYNEAR